MIIRGGSYPLFVLGNHDCYFKTDENSLRETMYFNFAEIQAVRQNLMYMTGHYVEANVFLFDCKVHA